MIFDLKKQNRLGFICLIFSVLFAFVSILRIFLNKYICAGDTFWHYSNEINLVRSILDFKGIFTCFPKGLGTPVLTFYQPLFYLIVATINLFSFKFISVYLAHNIMVVLLFSVYPLSVFYFARSFRFSILKSGLISVFSLFAISSCGHTLEACLSLGVHTQLIGTVVLPVSLGALHRLSFSKNQIRVFAAFTLSLLFIILGHAVYLLLIGYIIPLYLICFAVCYGWVNFFVLLRKLLLAAVIVLVFASFWLAPFVLSNNEYRHISPVERSGNAIYHSLTIKDFVHTFFKGELLDNTCRQSPLLRKDGKDKGLRWANNWAFARYRIFTIFSIAGFLLFLCNFRKFKNLYYLLLFFMGISLFLGTDDMPLLKLLPFMSSFQNIRAILIVELMCAVFSGLFFDRLIFVSANLLRRGFRHPQKMKKCIFYVIGVFLVFCLLITVYVPLKERYITARKLASGSARTKAGDLRKAFAVIKGSKNYKNSAKIFFNENSFYRSFADCCSIDTVMGLDTFVGSSLAWLIGDVSHRVAKSSALLGLFGVNYVAFKHGLVDETINYNPLYKGRYFDVYEVLDDHPFFFTPKKKPVLVYSSKKSWYFLNKIWLRNYLKNNNIAHMVKATDNFYTLLNRKIISSVVLLNFPDDEKTKKVYLDYFKDFIKSNGIIYSNKPLWGLPVRKIIPSDEKSVEKILLSSNLNTFSAELDDIVVSRYEHTFKYSTAERQLVIAKTVYYHMWKAFSSQSGALDTFCVSPGYVGCLIDNPGNDTIKLEYKSSKLHTILFLFGMAFLGAMFCFRKKFTYLFITLNDDVVDKRTISIFAGIIVFFFLIYFSINYVQQSYLLKTPLIYPLNSGKNLSPFEVTFHWNRLSDQDKYDFQVAEDKQFSQLSAEVKNRKANFVICNGLKEEYKYYWRVKTIAEDEKYGWSKIYCFYTSKY